MAEVAGAVAVISAVASFDQKKQAAGDQKKAAEIQQGQQQQADAQATRQRIREERVRRAQILASASNTGVSGSSGEAGSISSLQSLTGSRTAFQSGQAAGSLRASESLQSAQKSLQKSAFLDTIGGIASTYRPGPDEPAPIFEGTPIPGNNP